MPADLTSVLSESYDAVPYTSHPFPQTAPENLEAIAYLFGLAACPPARARVLELGCASGGNLIPMAVRYPELQAVGVDLSSVQIQQGQKTIEQAGLTNIELKCLNLEEIDATLGQFDYIICHGVYSWVPPAVQSAILRIASENLTPNGVAYVSYNTYPGWKAREVVRDAMLFRGGARSTPAEKLSYARGMVDFLHDMARDGSVLKKTLEEAMPIIKGARDDYLLHEYLEACNAPCYLKDFAAAAQSHGLAYLGDAEPSSMFVSNYGVKAAQPLINECGGSQLVLEQYIDFLVNRQFRQTLLVKAERQPAVRYALDNERLRAFEYAGYFHSAEPLTLEEKPVPCKAWRNMDVTLSTPVHKAMARAFNTQYPATLSALALLQNICKAVKQPLAVVEPLVIALLNELIVSGAIRYRRTPVQSAKNVSKKPQAFTQSSPHMLCNAWHETVTLDLVQQIILPLLDGQHDLDALAAHMVKEAQAGHIQLLHQGTRVIDSAGMLRCAKEQLPTALAALRHHALLTA